MMSFLTALLEKYRFVGLLLLLGLGALRILSIPRWQYSPLYLFTALFFILIVLRYFGVFDLTPRSSKWILGTGISLVFLSMAFFLIFPKEDLPLPSGPYEVGTRVFDLEDTERDELYTDAFDDHRKIKIQVWYPTDRTDGYEKAKWISGGTILTRQLASSMHLPSFMLDHTADIDSNSYLHAPLSASQDTYPVVVISHGWLGFRELHTDYAEELASHGFIAVSIDHTYGAQAVTFKDGSVAYLNKEALPSQSDHPAKFSVASTALVRTYGNDVLTVLNDLEKQNVSEGDFKGRLNLEAIGLLGHSTGGGGDVYATSKDPRIAALLGLDAWVNPLPREELEQGLNIPALFLRSEEWSEGPNNLALKALLRNSENAAFVQMNKTTHVDFSMSYMYSPITKYVGFTGALGGRNSSKIQREVILSFFETHLNHSKDPTRNTLEELIEQYEVLEPIDLGK